MKITDNTILITGGASGIGRGLAESLHALGNKVIIAGRRRQQLDEVTAANPGIDSIELDICSPAGIQAVAKEIAQKYPALNVLVNNAGISKIDDPSQPLDDAQAEAIVTTNFLGSIRMTSALIEHLKQQPHAAVLYTTSGLGFVPLALAAVYSATKAALHSYILSQRFKLRHTSVEVIEIAPPYVQTELGGERQKNDPRAMPLDAYIKETMELLAAGHQENVVERARDMRNNPGPNEHAMVNKFNEAMSSLH